MRDMDTGFSRFEILTTTVAVYLCLGFVCVFLEAGEIERELAVGVKAEAAASLLWVGAEAQGQRVVLSGAAESEAARAAALERAAAVPGVAHVENQIELVAEGAMCQSALDARIAEGIGFDRTEILEASFAVLEDIASVASQCAMPLEVAIHMDSRGDAEINRKLSQKRADNVARYLVSAGVRAAQISAVGLGESQPTTLDGSNERIEIRVREPLA